VRIYILDLGFFSSHRILNWKTEACKIAWYPLHCLQAFSPWTDSVGKERRNFYQLLSIKKGQTGIETLESTDCHCFFACLHGMNRLADWLTYLN